MNNWLEPNEETDDSPIYTYLSKDWVIICTCSAYAFPHRKGGGMCTECNECGQPSHNCVCEDPYHRYDL